MVDRFANGKLEATDLATITWLATAAGLGGDADLAVDPESKGDNHATRVRKALGLTEVESKVLYECEIPMWDVAKGRRQVRPLLVKLPHEALVRDFYNNRDKYRAARSDPDNIDVPIARRHGKDACWPCGYYTDSLGTNPFTGAQ